MERAYFRKFVCPLTASMIVAFAVEMPAADLAPLPDLTLDQAVSESLASNPSLRSALLKADAAAERPVQASGLPNPMFQYGGMDAANGGHFPDTPEKRFMIEQSFPAPGKRRLGGDVARQETAVAQREAESTALDTVMQVKETYFGLYGTQQSLAIVREEQAILTTMEKIAGAKYAVGEGAQEDVLKARSELALLRQKLAEMEAGEAVLKSRLNTLMSRNPELPLGRAVTPPASATPGSLDALLALADKTRPEIKVAEAQVARDEAEQRLKSRDYLPDYRFGIEYRDFSREDDMLMVTVGLELPLWRTRYRAAVSEAAAVKASSEAALESARRQAANEVVEARLKLSAARRILDSCRTALIPQAEARCKAGEAAYRAGKAGLADVLESQRILLEARLTAAGAEADGGVQAARLERAVGTGHEVNKP